MPIHTYTVHAPTERKEQRRFVDEFSMKGQFEKRDVFGFVITVDSWAFDEFVKPKRVSDRGWLHLGRCEFARARREERELDLVRILKSKMKIKGNDAETLVNNLFDDLDRIARERDVEPFSQREKEQMVLAITETAGNLVKEIFKKRLQ